ncbi:hypothetical protein [Flavobacterium silvaticum]|uniref:Uncharacterized protein n=1 Tax=Flavobacterium silvaticum TaxID=1852020 RepID=A0A972FRP8_9FLAO|nr:hypothetical protein [Flavobacterium silvaticum]NMH28144.1 hypothetical protein [Flavobacterium silvaticum]
MESHEIKSLLEKYMDAMTSVEEEKSLADYFRNNAVSPEFEEYKSMFGYFEDQRSVVPEKNFRISDTKKRRRTWIPAAAAAVLLLGVGIYGWQNQTPPQTSELGTFDDPEVALRETRKALDLLSSKVNTGMESVNYLNEYEQSKNVIFKN